MRTFLGLSTLLVVISAGVLTWTIEHGSEPQTTRHLKVSFGGAPESLDPAQVNGLLEARILLSLYEGLTRLDPETLEPVPGVAKDWSVSENGLRWTFPFRTGENAARWSNGDRVRPADFEFAWKRVLSTRPPSPYASQLYRYIENAGAYNFRSTLNALSGDNFSPVDGRATEDRTKKLLRSFNRLRQYGTREHIDKVPIFRSILRQYANRLSDGPDWAKRYIGRIKKARRQLPSLRTSLKKRPPVTWSDVGIDAGSHSITISLRSPTPYFASLTAFMTYYPIKKDLIQQFPADVERDHDLALAGNEMKWTRPEHLVTNGPYRLSDWVFSDRMTMTANPHYWQDDKPHVKRITYLVIENGLTALSMFQEGTLHLSTVVPNKLKGDLSGRPNYHEWPWFGTRALRFNVDRAPLGDPRVRKAIAMAIDREKLTGSILRGNEQPTTSWVPPGTGGYQPPDGIDFQPQRARKLLKDAGYPNGEGIDPIGCLIVDRNSYEDLFVGIQKMVRTHTGIQLKARKKGWNSYIQQQKKRNYETALSGWIGDYYDPMTFLDMFITGGKNNRTNWGSPRYDRLIEQAGKATRQERRFELFRRAEAILIRKKLPLSPLFHFTSTALWDETKLDGIHKNKLGLIDLKHVRFQKK